MEIPDDGATSPENVPVYLDVTVKDVSFRQIFNYNQSSTS